LKLLLDTHILLWAAGMPEKLSEKARDLLSAVENELVFSAASLWEITIKNGLGRTDFQVDARRLRRGLIDNGYLELAISAQHVLGVSDLPPLHKDPFDRLLIAQSTAEGIVLISADPAIAQYPGSIEIV
jgi:PIN domain nuclease of toxin-antitoxin system